MKLSTMEGIVQSLGSADLPERLGACAMTTKFLDNKICTFKILLSWRVPRKTAFLDNLLVCPQGTPPLKSANFIFIVVSLAPKGIMRHGVAQR